MSPSHRLHANIRESIARLLDRLHQGARLTNTLSTLRLSPVGQRTPPLRLEAYAMHCAGTHHGIVGEPIGNLLEEVLPNLRRKRLGGIEDGSSSASVSFKGGISRRLAAAEALGTLLGTAPILPGWKPPLRHGSPVLSSILARGAEPKLGAEHGDLV
jgi:hypothetical protein